MTTENSRQDTNESTTHPSHVDEARDDSQTADTAAKRDAHWQRERGIKNGDDQKAHEKTGAEHDKESGDTVV